MEEIWKDIQGYEGLYKVSNLGNVKRLKLLKSAKDSKGYFYVNLSKNGKVKCCRVHQLVAKAFIPNPNNFVEINHIDGIKTNNKVDNLEWCDHRHNMQHAFDNELISKKSVKYVVEKMTSATKKPIVQIKNGVIINTFESIADAKRKTKISHICECLKGKIKHTKGFEWKYK